MTNLLNKPLRSYILFTIIVLACSIPAYFILIERIWINELDDHNQSVKDHLKARFTQLPAEDLTKKIALWNEIQSNSKIVSTSTFKKDSVYTIEREILEGDILETERFRGLASSLILNDRSYSLIIETNVEEVHETVIAIAFLTCFFILCLIAGFIVLNRRLSQKIWKPFTNALEKLRKFDLNSSEAIDFDETDILEFAELNEVLSKLIDNNIQLYQRQKEFTQNASHELQTPLALIKSKLDLLIQEPTLSTEQRKLIEDVENSLLRVTRINKNLLVLAGIENRDFKSESIDLSSLVNELTETFRDFAESKQGNIFVNVSPGKTITADESLVEILISNLISNAIRHSYAGSEIKILLYEGVLIVTNDGVSALNKKDLFKRFSTVSSENPGTGLGLAIVKEICTKYNWQPAYEFKTNRHVFSIFF